MAFSKIIGASVADDAIDVSVATPEAVIFEIAIIVFYLYLYTMV